MRCPECGRTMRHTQEPFLYGGENFVEWECPNEDCWFSQTPSNRTIPAPEYNIVYYALDADELRQAERNGVDTETLAALRREHNEAKRRFPSAWRRYRG